VFVEEELEACWRYLVRWLSLKMSDSSFFGFIAKFLMLKNGGFKGRKIQAV